MTEFEPFPGPGVERVEVVGAVVPGEAYAEAVVAELMGKQAPEPLGRGEFFTGRPGTGVVCGDGRVAKVRLDLDLDWDTARRWVRHALDSERALGLHHPAKTWFLARVDGENRIGNVAPLLEPLHQELPVLSGEDQYRLLARLLGVYLEAATGPGKRLDEGLSNFGRDRQGRLFYLDDDTYDWDDFRSLAEALGYWIRLPLGLGTEGLTALGQELGRGILRHFGDPHWLRVLAQRLNRLFVANAEQAERRTALVEGIQSGHPSFRARMAAPEATGSTERTGSDLLAILADVHANRPALEAVLAYLKAEGITRGIVLGDVVGYGPHPQGCIELLRDSGLTLLKGNHDHAAANSQSRKGFSNTAYWVIEWTRGVLGEEAKGWLDGLPCCLEGEDWLALHGAPRDPTFFNGYVYHMTYEANLDELQDRGVPICFHGHTHIQGTYYRTAKGRDGFSGDPGQELREWRHCLVCPGSVGQPRDGKPGAAFALFHPETGELSHRRVDYDVDPVIDEMEGQGFPRPLLDRLRSGR
ncbi:metallophosphoesterase family protein [Thiohalorhabdus denitrificans]|uniref:Predicted phosphodiesterase n=1 Tax=Thiohalorhabdus denitrificans TaxID=381306 RepID=A0A1G5G3J1_9GAMM|nr:metallophosphoesterase family protein [Thiohalorhabdus denitrificans]SCY46074.1 Predicted phosphodiesterase [Thiohalorhabdus denitrificans]